MWLDLHRQQITFDAVETESGEVWRVGCGSPIADGSAAGCTPTSLAEPMGNRWQWRWRVALAGDTWSRRSPRRASRRTWPSRRTRRRRGAAAARQDGPLRRPDAARVVAVRRSPRVVDPPTAVLEWRERVRLYKSLVDQRRVWTQRIHAELFQHGVAVPEAAIRSVTTRERLTGDEVTLTPAGGNGCGSATRSLETQPITWGTSMIDTGEKPGWHRCSRGLPVRPWELHDAELGDRRDGVSGRACCGSRRRRCGAARRGHGTTTRPGQSSERHGSCGRPACYLDLTARCTRRQISPYASSPSTASQPSGPWAIATRSGTVPHTGASSSCQLAIASW